MKNLRSAYTVQITAVVVGTLLLLGEFAMLGLQGCGTNAPTKAAQVDHVVIVAVNKGIPIIVKKINAGELTRKQCNTFDKLYQDYYDAQMVVKAVIEKANSAGANATLDDINRAQTAVNSAETALLNFINSVL